MGRVSTHYRQAHGLRCPKTATVVHPLYSDSSLPCESMHILSYPLMDRDSLQARVKPPQIPVPGHKPRLNEGAMALKEM